MAKTTVSKKKIQLDDLTYQTLTATCVCGASFETGSTLETVRVDVCSNCHPFFTGENRILDTEGRVEKFRKKYELAKKKQSEKKS